MTQGKFQETEVKLYVPDLGAVMSRLVEIGAECVMERVFEHNVRYENEAGTLTQNGIVVRLRQDNAVRLTYKEPPEQLDEAFPTRLEAEVTVSDYETMDLILRKLGFHPHIAYEKYRTTYRVADTEVMLDEMPFGNFVEIEGAVESIRRTLHQLSLENATQFRENYITLFDRIRHNMGLDCYDLTFANFEHVSVAEEAFFARAPSDTTE